MFVEQFNFAEVCRAVIERRTRSMGISSRVRQTSVRPPHLDGRHGLSRLLPDFHGLVQDVQPLFPPTVSAACSTQIIADMHRVFLIPELTSKIAEECTTPTLPGHGWSSKYWTGNTITEGMRTLNALARTCHVLMEPALDVLWYRQDTLTRLLRCLPDDLWRVAKASDGRTELASLTQFVASCR